MENQLANQPMTYTVPAECKNCEWTGDVNIPKGFVVETAKCPECGCETLYLVKIRL